MLCVELRKETVREVLEEVREKGHAFVAPRHGGVQETQHSCVFHTFPPTPLCPSLYNLMTHLCGHNWPTDNFCPNFLLITCFTVRHQLPGKQVHPTMFTLVYATRRINKLAPVQKSESIWPLDHCHSQMLAKVSRVAEELEHCTAGFICGGLKSIKSQQYVKTDEDTIQQTKWHKSLENESFLLSRSKVGGDNWTREKKRKRYWLNDKGADQFINLGYQEIFFSPREFADLELAFQISIFFFVFGK